MMQGDRRSGPTAGSSLAGEFSHREEPGLLRRRALVAAAIAGLVLPTRPSWAAGETSIDLRDLYDRDMAFTPLARSLDGERVRVSGYMAPPLKADARFFVLTTRPMSICPFCDSSADWSDDILAVYIKRALEVAPFYVEIEARGTLQLGELRDRATQFVSRVRLSDATYG